MPTPDELGDQLKHHLKAARDLADAAEKAGRDLTEEERGQVKTSLEKAREVKQALDDANASEQTKAAIRELGDSIGLDLNGKGGKDRIEQASRDGLRGRDGRKSIGQQYVESEQYKSMMANAGPNGFTKESRVQGNPVGFKALVTGGDDTSAGAFVDTDRRGLLDGPEQFFRPLTLRQLVTTGTTESDAIEYSRITGIANNAAIVPEATTAAAPTAPGEAGPMVPAVGGGYKPESGFTAVRKETSVKTIAHWLPATKRSLSDASQVLTLIDNFLEIGLEEELEDQMVGGNGQDDNFEGLRAVSGTQAQAPVADPTGKPDGLGKLLALRRGKTKVRRGGRAVANGYVINPVDLEGLDEITDGDGRFYFNGPAGGNNSTPLWDLPVIESESTPVGEAWVGDWRWAILWDRQQATITSTDSHADFFVRNLVAILCEMRAAFAIIRPAAFCKVTLT